MARVEESAPTPVPELSAPADLAVTYAMIEEARERFGSAIYKSPCAYTQTLSERTGAKVYLKLENLQMTGSFKERGALNKLLSLTDSERRRGVIAASAGNHAQGVAYHARRLGVPTTIVMPEGSPLIKIDRTRRFGATVLERGADYDEAYAAARALAADQDLVFVHAFDDPLVIAGQGTIGLELLDQNPFLEVVILPVGGGGLIGGVALALKETNPRIRVIGVEAESLPGMRAAVDAGHPTLVPPGQTIADGIAVRRVGELPFALVQRYVDALVTVDEEELANAILVLLEHEKTVVEGAGASTLAALLNGHVPQSQGKKTCLVLTGGNIDVNVIARIIERGLAKDGRRMRLAVDVPDRPGALARLLARVAELRGNVLEIYHDRAFGHAAVGWTRVRLTLETRGPEHIEQIEQTLTADSYRVERA